MNDATKTVKTLKRPKLYDCGRSLKDRKHPITENGYTAAFPDDLAEQADRVEVYDYNTAFEFRLVSKHGKMLARKRVERDLVREAELYKEKATALALAWRQTQ